MKAMFVLMSLLVVGCSSTNVPTRSDGDQPQILGMSPAPSQTWIAADQSIGIAFDEAMDAASVETNLTVLYGEAPLSGRYEWDESQMFVEFRPDTHMISGDSVRIQVREGITDREGDSLSGSDGTPFQTLDFACLVYEDGQSFRTNGERIYFTATSESGEPVTIDDTKWVAGPGAYDHLGPTDLGFEVTGPAMMHSGGGGMMGGRRGGAARTVGLHAMACASCHGPDGKGSRRIGSGLAEAPDIRYSVLTGQVAGSDHEHLPYTDEEIGVAILNGLDSESETLDDRMPRWSMADEDLADLIEFLKSL